MGLERRNDIDGLRAIAVLLVLFFHANLFDFPGGFVGVDVFFVISGFVITSVIIREQHEGRFSVKGFFIRRIRRIMPAATAMVLVTLFVGIVFLSPGELVDLVKSAFAQPLLCSNAYFWMTSGYFDGPTELKPLLHTWSLAVEEQFYVIYPLLLILVRHWTRRGMIILLFVIGVLSFAASEYTSYRFAMFNFYLLPTRAWELIIGAILAYACIIPSKPQATTGILFHCLMNFIAGLGLVMIVASAYCYSSSTRFPGGNALPPTIGAALFIYANSDQLTFAGKLAALKPLVFIGLASYSIYLWHWPILVSILKIAGPSLPLSLRVIAFVTSIVVGLGSWKYIEEPFRRGYILATDARLVWSAAATAICQIAFVCTLFWLDVPNWARFDRTGSEIHDSIIVRRAQITTRDRKLALPQSVETFGAKNAQPDDFGFVLWGDSHSTSVAALCEQLAVQRGLSGLVATQPGFAPLLGVYNNFKILAGKEQQLAWNQAVVDLVITNRIKHVIIVARWECKLNPSFQNDRLLEDGLIRDDATVTATPDDPTRVFREGLLRTLKTFDAVGAKVWFVMQVPVLDDDPVKTIAKAIAYKTPPRGISRVAYEHQQRRVTEVLKEIQLPALHVISPANDWFDVEGWSKIAEKKESFYWDRDHLSSLGAEKYFRRDFELMFNEIAGCR